MLTANRVMAWILLLIGVALIVRTALLTGGSVTPAAGYLGGVAFVALGVIRLRAASR